MWRVSKDRGLSVLVHSAMSAYRHHSAPSSSNLLSFSRLSLDQLHSELMRCGRRRVQDNLNMSPLLDELIIRQDRNAKPTLLRDALYLAHAASLHSRCTELFLVAARQEVGKIPLIEAVVDAAHAQGSARLMSSIVEAAAPRFTMSEGDPLSVVAALRAFWLCTLRSVELEQELILQRKASTSASNELTQHVPPVKTSETPQAFRQAAENIFKTIFSGISVGISLTSECQELWNFARRCVKYHYAGDGGEAQFYLRCYQKDMVPKKTSHAVTLSMMKSCNRSQDVKLIRAYFADFVQSLERNVADESKDGVASSSAAVADAEEKTPSTTKPAKKSSKNADSSNKMPEIVVHTYLQCLVNSREFHEVCDAAEDILNNYADYTPSFSVIAVISRAAGETKNLSLSLRCAEMLFRDQTMTPSKDSTVEEDGDNVDGVKQNNAQRFPSGYEVFTVLMSLAKCHASNFPMLLQQIRATAAMCPTDEECLCLKLHFTRRSVTMLQEISEILASIRAKPMAAMTLLSQRNMTLILIILQSSDHPQFFSTLKEFYHRSDDRRFAWMSICLQWAEGHRCAITSDQRLWILKEIENLHAKSPCSANPSTDSLWHTLTANINPAVGDVAMQKGSISLFLADCHVQGLITSWRAFLTSSFEWPTNESALRFSIAAPKRLLQLRSSDEPCPLVPSSASGMDEDLLGPRVSWGDDNDAENPATAAVVAGDRWRRDISMKHVRSLLLSEYKQLQFGTQL